MSNSTVRPLSKPLAWSLVVTPLLLFYGILALFVTPVPIEDDYDAILGYALRWQAASSWSQHLSVLNSQHNEYKLFFQNVLLGLEVSLTHHVDLGAWIWAGNALILLCLIPLWRICAPRAPLTSRLLLFAPVLWIFVNVDYAETMNFAISGMQEVPVLVFGLACVYLATRPQIRKNLYACGLAFLACATYANAFMLAPIGFALFQRKGRRRVLLVWIACFALILALYLYHYVYRSHPRAHVWQYLVFLPALTGSAFGVYRLAIPITVFSGFLMLAIFAYSTVRRFDQTQLFAYWSLVWLLLTFVLTTYGRTWMGVGVALGPRYRIYSCLAVALLYLLVVSNLEGGPERLLVNRKLYAVVIIASIVFGLAGDAFGYQFLKSRRERLLYGMQRYVASHGAESPLVYAAHREAYLMRPETEERMRTTLTRAIDAGLYRIPDHY